MTSWRTELTRIGIIPISGLNAYQSHKSARAFVRWRDGSDRCKSATVLAVGAALS